MQMRAALCVVAALALAVSARAECTISVTGAAAGTTGIDVSVISRGCGEATALTIGLYHDVNLTVNDPPYAGPALTANTAVSGDDATADITTTVHFVNTYAGCYYLKAYPTDTPAAWVTQPTPVCTACADVNTVPTLNVDASKVDGQTLTIVINEPLRYAAVQYQFPNARQGSTVCDIGYGLDAAGDAAQEGAWTRNWKTAASCDAATAVYVVNDWNKALATCGWTRNEEDPDDSIFTTVILITTKSQGVVIRGVHLERVEQSSISISVAYGTAVEASVSSSIFGPVLKLASLYKTTFDPGSELFNFLLLTSVQAPYQLSLPAVHAISATPTSASSQNGKGTFTDITFGPADSSALTIFSFSQSGWDTAVGADAATKAACVDISQAITGGAYAPSNFETPPPSATTPACTQFWQGSSQKAKCSASTAATIVNDPNGPSRDLTATWTQVFNVGCDSTFKGACDIPETQVTVTFTTASDNYCLRLFATDAAAATLEVFATAQDRAGWNTKDGVAANTNHQFVFGTTSYFRARITSSGAVMYWARAEEISITSGYKTATHTEAPWSGNVAGALPRQGLYSHRWTDSTWWAQPATEPTDAARDSGFVLTELINAPTGSTFVFVDFSWVWTNLLSAASGDFPTTTVVRFDGRARFISGTSSVSERPLSAWFQSNNNNNNQTPRLMAVESTNTISSQPFGVRASSAAAPAPNQTAGSVVSSGMIAVGAAVAGVAIVAAGVAAGALRRRRKEQARNEHHLASVSLDIPSALSASSSQAQIDV